MPISCAKGCGYFGTAENRNMCSVCYKEFLKRDIITASSKPTVVTVDQPNHHHVSSSSASGKDIVVSEITAQSGGSTGRKIRCKSCNRKVGLTGFRCRCGDLFCGMHRLPEAHECNVDYKTVRGRNDGDLAEIIKGDKLQWRV